MAPKKSWRMLQLVCSGFCERPDFFGASDIILGYALKLLVAQKQNNKYIFLMFSLVNTEE
jgi:hypothetical protein